MGLAFNEEEPEKGLKRAGKGKGKRVREREAEGMGPRSFRPVRCSKLQSWIKHLLADMVISLESAADLRIKRVVDARLVGGAKLLPSRALDMIINVLE